MIELLESLRNLYSASGGVTHPSSVAAALYGMMWNNAWDAGLAAGQAAQNAGGSDREVSGEFQRAFAETLGWSDAQFDEFWTNESYKITPEDAQRFDASWDAFDAFVESMRRGAR